ncbi:hypothetical protein N7528_001915 [Penicillium herquei]|nr:hypothetical protein N7528_001915 [Penicillium herquei]
MNVSWDSSLCEQVFQYQTPWYGILPTEEIINASSVLPRDSEDEDVDYGNFDPTQIWQHYFTPFTHYYSISISGVFPQRDIILAPSILSEGSAYRDQNGGNFEHTRFWHDFFTYWMHSAAISVFPHQDDDMGRSPDICVGGWLRDEWHPSLPAKSGIILAVACLRNGEQIDELAYTQVRWAMQRLYMHNQVWASEETQRFHCPATRVVWFQPVIWVAITTGRKVYFHRVHVEGVWKPTATNDLTYFKFEERQWTLQSWHSMSLELESGGQQIVSMMNRIAEDRYTYLRTS